MTAAWDRFQAAYDALGRDRAEGYDRSAFEGLDDGERALALTMVLARAAAGEPAEVRALAFFDDPAALAGVERVFARERAPSLLRLAAARAGHALTGDPVYERAIVVIAERGEGAARRIALVTLCAMPLTADGLQHVTARLLTEADALTAVQLAKAVLRAKGVAVDAMDDFTRALPLVRQLVVADLAMRAESVARLDALIAQHAAG